MIFCVAFPPSFDRLETFHLDGFAEFLFFLPQLRSENFTEVVGVEDTIDPGSYGLCFSTAAFTVELSAVFRASSGQSEISNT